MKGFTMKYLIKFFPSILVLIVFHFLSLYFKCKRENDNLEMVTVAPAMPMLNLLNMNDNNNNEFDETNQTFTKNLTFITSYNKHNCHLFAFDL